MGLTAGSRHTAAIVLLSLAVVLVLAFVACSGGTSTPTPTPTAAAKPTTAPTSTNSLRPTAASAPTISPSLAASLLASSSPVITGAQVCADLAAFQASLDALTGLTSGSAAVRDVLGAVEATITTGKAFVESAKATFGPEAQALGTALAGLQTALQGLTGEGTLGDKAATIENAIDDVAAAFDALKAKVAPGCPAPEASGS
jgi:hypothetical protein